MIPKIIAGRCLGYLGRPQSDHRENFVHLMAAAGREVCVLEDSASLGVYDRPPAGLRRRPLSTWWRRGYRLSCQLAGTHNRAYRERLARALDESGARCVLAYWGLRPMPDIIALKKVRPDVKVVLNVLCHPLGLSPRKVAVENWLFRRSARYCDGLLVSSRVMEEYLRGVLGGRDAPPFLRWPPCLAEHYHPATPLPPCPYAPNVLFLGRMDWWGGQPTDNVVGFVDALLDHGVHVYHHRTAERLPAHGRRHLFDYLPMREATAFATQFDASLIVYNLEACSRRDRFRVTVPDRLIASVAAGLPVALPRRGYDACKEYLRAYGAVIEFDTPVDLARALADRAEVARLKRLAWQNRGWYVAERHLGALADFLGAISTGLPSPLEGHGGAAGPCTQPGRGAPVSSGPQGK